MRKKNKVHRRWRNFAKTQFFDKLPAVFRVVMRRQIGRSQDVTENMDKQGVLLDFPENATEKKPERLDVSEEGPVGG